MMRAAARVRLVPVLLALSAAIAGCGGAATTAGGQMPRTQQPQALAPAAPAAISVGSHVWVSVAVATLWVSPRSPRAVDAPALRAPVEIRRWLASMSTTVRRGLVGRVETQALLGDPLTVTGVSGSWLHVVAPRQSTSRDRRGYPGWVPSRQVTTRQPQSAATVATVTRLTAWLRTSTDARVVEVSLGTRLPVLSRTSSTVTVTTPTGARLRVWAGAVSVRTPSAAALPATGSAVLATARRFLGVPYIWGARSGFAVDCSGFTGLVYALHGRRLPRDADDQSWAGVGITRATRAGDLTFYGPSRAPTHVAMYVGGGTLIHAPSTGHPVAYVAVRAMSTPVRSRRVL